MEAESSSNVPVVKMDDRSSEIENSFNQFKEQDGERSVPCLKSSGFSEAITKVFGTFPPFETCAFVTASISRNSALDNEKFHRICAKLYELKDDFNECVNKYERIILLQHDFYYMKAFLGYCVEENFKVLPNYSLREILHSIPVNVDEVKGEKVLESFGKRGSDYFNLKEFTHLCRELFDEKLKSKLNLLKNASYDWRKQIMAFSILSENILTELKEAVNSANQFE